MGKQQTATASAERERYTYSTLLTDAPIAEQSLLQRGCAPREEQDVTYILLLSSGLHVQKKTHSPTLDVKQA